MASALCAVVWAALLLTGCSSTRHVAKGSFLLDKVSITVEDSADIATKKLHNYLRQQPNHKILGFAKLQLGVYNLSGRDSTSRGCGKSVRNPSSTMRRSPTSLPASCARP